MKLSRPSRSLLSYDFDLTPPSRNIADQMAAVYFSSFESTYRILHIPSFWKEYDDFWKDPGGAKPDLRLKVLLVIGIGSRIYNGDDADAKLAQRVRQWIYATQLWLSGPLEKNRLELSGLQIYCLVILARQVFSVGADLIWMSMGSLVHRAIQVGLHRDPKHLPDMPLWRAELRRRLWATILEMLVQSSLDSSMPPRMSAEDFDTEPPANINDEDIDPSTTTVRGFSRETYTGVSMQLVLLDSMPIRLRILRLINGISPDVSYVDVLTLSSELTTAIRAVSQFCQANRRSGVSAFHQNLLNFLLRRFMIPLHEPFAHQAKLNPLFHFSLQTCLDTAMILMAPELDERFSKLMVAGGGMFRESINHALFLIGLELLVQVEAKRLDGTLHRNNPHIETLKRAMSDLMPLSAERIRQGDTNVKGYMFLAMILAYIEAKETGSHLELSVARSGRDSLLICHELLCEQAGLLQSSCPSEAGFVSASDQDNQAFDFNLEMFLSDADFL
jgi:hypothetical protein